MNNVRGIPLQMLPEDRHVILGEMGITGNHGHFLDLRLSDEQAVKGIPVITKQFIPYTP
jgi:hypothetical protein